MADETATISDNTTEPTEQATTPTPAPTPASAPKPHAPSPAAFAKKAVKRPAPAASASSYSDAEVKAAEAFGRVDDNGTVYVREGDSEREVGSSPTSPRRRRCRCTPVVTLTSRPSWICWRAACIPTR